MNVLLLLAVAAMSGSGTPTPHEASLVKLLTIHRVYVDRLTGGETAAQMRDILISSLAAAELFTVTEDQERADAVIRGAAEDLVFTEIHQTSDNVNAHASLGAGRGSGVSRTANSAGLAIGESEAERSTDRRHEAIAAVRIVNKDGDVIWSTIQESLGAKFHGASADVAEKITARLKDDFEKARQIH